MNENINLNYARSFIMTTTIQKWGNSQGIRLPKHILEALNWHEGEKLDIKTEK